VGTELNLGVNYAKIADACGVKGVQVKTVEETTQALNTAIKEQMNNGVTTFIEVVLNQELGEPFRRDAMKKPVEVADINAADMRPQKGS
jgi:sulfoacetaldehyde acetyltransferase